MDHEQTIKEIESALLEYAENKEDIMITPSEILSGSGSAWFYDPVNKTMELVKRGDQLTRNDAYVDQKNRILSYISGKVVLIPEEEIIEIVFN
jgi:hypothetical protein